MDDDESHGDDRQAVVELRAVSELLMEIKLWLNLLSILMILNIGC
jgi:hypothetical protein